VVVDRELRAAVIVSIGTCGACSLLIGTKDLQPPPDEVGVAVDGAAVDAGTLDVVTTDAAPAACVSLLPNGGFEQAPNCAPWFNYGGPAFDSTPARSGANACGLCVGPSGGTINFFTRLEGHPFGPGEALHVELWVRAKDDALYAQRAHLAVGTDLNPVEERTMFLSTEYQPLGCDISTPLDGGPAQTAYIQLLVPSPSDAGCILVDDVVACRPDGG
jgi:hypothetical protein